MEKLKIPINIFSVVLAELAQDEQEMILKAREATKNAHAPYSNFYVGSAVQFSDMSLITGANQENAAYPSGLCAERTTLFSAFNLGRKRDIAKLAVTARPGGVQNYIGTRPVGPCGACRQVMKEAEESSGTSLIILLDCYNNNKIIRVVGVDSLLPISFGPSDLGLDLSKIS